MSGLRTPRRPLGRRIAFSAVAAALLLLAVEATARLFGMPSGLVRRLHEAADMPPDDFAGSVGMFRPAFRGRVGWPPELAFDLAVNRLGLRGPETTLEKPAGTYRILCLGDSTTFGLFVADSEAYPRRLEAALRADLPQIEVLNAGVPGFGTHDQLRFLRERAHRLAPDLVVHLFCQNDLTDIGEDVGGEHGAYARWLARIADHPPWPIRALGATATSELLTRLRIAWKAWRAGVPEHLEPGVLTGPPRAAFRHFEVVHRELARFCSERGIALVTACFPESDVRGPEATPPFEPELEAIAAAHGVPFVPLWRTFRAAEAEGRRLYLLPIDWHANAEGHALLAASLAAALKVRALGPYAAR